MSKKSYKEISAEMMHIDNAAAKIRTIIRATPTVYDSLNLYEFRMKKLNDLYEQKKRLSKQMDELLSWIPMEWVYANINNENEK